MTRLFFLNAADLFPELCYLLSVPLQKQEGERERCRASTVAPRMKEEDRQNEAKQTEGSDLHQMQRGVCGWPSEGVAGKEGKLVEGGWG